MPIATLIWTRIPYPAFRTLETQIATSPPTLTCTRHLHSGSVTTACKSDRTSLERRTPYASASQPLTGFTEISGALIPRGLRPQSLNYGVPKPWGVTTQPSAIVCWTLQRLQVRGMFLFSTNLNLGPTMFSRIPCLDEGISWSLHSSRHAWDGGNARRGVGG